MTTKEVADYLSVSVGTVTRWIREEKLEATKIGKSYRISEANLKKFIMEEK